MLKRVQLLAFVTVVAAPIVLGAPALGAECIEVKVPDSVKAGGADLVLNGLGIRKATFLEVKVYVAGLYLPQKSGDSGKIIGTNQPWQLVLHFVRDVDASDIRDAFGEGFTKNAGDKLAALQPRIKVLNARMVDFKEGHYLSFANDAAKGVAVDVNGAGGGAIEGADFAAALLSVWLGPEPPNEDLKAGLLGGKCE
jgi:Chalcone isomerase-like